MYYIIYYYIFYIIYYILYIIYYILYYYIIYIIYYIYILYINCCFDCSLCRTRYEFYILKSKKNPQTVLQSGWSGLSLAGKGAELGTFGIFLFFQ